MVQITAEAVKRFRQRTGLPLMDCKRALQEAEGDEERAIETLRRRGEKLAMSRSDRETAFGRFGIYAGLDKPAGAIVELKCESAPVTQNEEFIQLASDMAEALAKAESEIETEEQLLALPLPSDPSKTLGDQKQEMFNRIREVFNVGRFARVAGPTAGYSHNAGTVSGVLLEVEGGNPEAAYDVAMHIAGMRPTVLTIEELDPELVAKERSILTEAVQQEGKPANIAEKIVEGRLRTGLFADEVLLEQPFLKDNKTTIGQYLKQHGMKVARFIHWELGQE